MMGKAMQCGFLGMIFLASGTSALQCNSVNYIWNLRGKAEGPTAVDLESPNQIVSCSTACIEEQLLLSIANSLLLVTHRGCAGKEGQDRDRYLTTDESHFIIQYNASYCSSDLCNTNMKKYFPWSPREDKGPEESGSIQCNVGLSLNLEVIPDRVTCRKGYDQCYSGQGNVTAGPLTVPLFIKTCHKNYCIDCTKSITGSSIKVDHRGSSCMGNYCNGKKTDV